MRVLLWHVHGSWATSFVQGPHTYLLPLTPERDEDGRGRATSWDWPSSVHEVPVGELASAAPDVVLLQRPTEAALLQRWTGLVAGEDVPAVYVEHNTPDGAVPLTRHPMAGQDRVPVVHVSHFNRLMWDSGSAPTRVVEHGIVDPGPRWTGELQRAAVAVNDPVRRGRFVGTDLLPGLTTAGPVDVFGMRVSGLAAHLGLDEDLLRAHEDLPQHAMHAELARRRVYVHTCRWTSLGLSLLEAMHLGMPVVALGTTEVPEAVPPGAGVVTTHPDVLVAEVGRLLRDPARAADLGARAREVALERYGLGRFLADWDVLLDEVVAGAPTLAR